MVCHQRTHLEYEPNQLNQYKEVVHILNVELTEKNTQLEKATHRYEELAKENTKLTMELATFYEQMVQDKADVMAGFWTSQPYYDKCGGLYGDSFDDFLK